MLRAVLDVNVVTSAMISPGGTPGRLLEAFVKQRRFVSIVSAPILDELRGTLSYPKVKKYLRLSPTELERTIAAFDILSERVTPNAHVKVIEADPDDDKYIAAAIEGRATHIVSGDKHLLNLKRYHDVSIVTSAALMKLIQ